MEKEIKEYIKWIYEELEAAAAAKPTEENTADMQLWRWNLDSLWTLHKSKVADFQHERHIHLLITMFFAAFAIACIFLLVLAFQDEAAFYLLSLILVILDGFYIKHYFFLENKTQSLYQVKDRIHALRWK